MFYVIITTVSKNKKDMTEYQNADYMLNPAAFSTRS